LGVYKKGTSETEDHHIHFSESFGSVPIALHWPFSIHPSTYGESDLLENVSDMLPSYWVYFLPVLAPKIEPLGNRITEAPTT